MASDRPLIHSFTLEELELVDAAPEAPFDNLTKLASMMLGTSVSLVSIVQVDRDRQFFKSQKGLPEPWATERQTPLSHSFCQHVVHENRPVAIDNAPAHKLVKDNLAIAALNVIAYLGVPIYSPENTPIGALCAIEGKARSWLDNDITILQQLASCVSDAILLKATIKTNEILIQRQSEQCERTESRSQAFLEAAPDATVIVDDAGRMQVVNAQTEVLFGYHREALIGRSVEMLIPERFKSGHVIRRERYFEKPHPRPIGVGPEFFGRRKDGSEFPVEINLSPVGSDRQRLISAAIRDISERQKMEHQNRVQQRELAHVGRLTTMGEMAAGLAHELNQPLTAITQYCDAAIVAMTKGDVVDTDVATCLKEAYEQAQRAGNIIRQLRQFVRKGETEKSPIMLNHLVEQTAKLIEPEARDKNVRIILTLTDEITDVVLDRIQIAQVLVNLIHNGIDAIETASSEKRAIMIESALDEGFVQVTVQDTGPGLRSLEDAFKPYETSKSEGLGMGLSISRSIVEAHGGRLWAAPETSEGARFHFTLPVQGPV